MDVWNIWGYVHYSLKKSVGTCRCRRHRFIGSRRSTFVQTLLWATSIQVSARHIVCMFDEQQRSKTSLAIGSKKETCLCARIPQFD